MKILFIAPYIYNQEYKEHSKNKTGFGIMVNDIARSVGNIGNEVIVTTHTFGPKHECRGYLLIKNSLFKNIIHGKYKCILNFNAKLKKEGIPLKSRLRELYYYLNLGYIEHLIKTEKPDIVHIHGCNSVTSKMITMCKNFNVPFIVTLHGLLEDDVSATNYQKQCERKFIRSSSEQNIPITVISSKIKERFLSEYYATTDNKNVWVITNGIEIEDKKEDCNLKEKLAINNGTNVILSVGSLCNLKNQIQTLRVFSVLPKPIKDNTVLVFAGERHKDYPILEETEALGLTDKVIFTGFIPRDELKNYYSIADITVTASITEGFGIPIIEGFSYGVPCVTFADLDAIADIYNPEAMIICQKRSDKVLAEAITRAMTTEWNREKIKKHAKNYSLEKMAEKYQQVYLEIKD